MRFQIEPKNVWQYLNITLTAMSTEHICRSKSKGKVPLHTMKACGTKDA